MTPAGCLQPLQAAPMGAVLLAGMAQAGRWYYASFISGTIALLITLLGKEFRREGLEKAKVWRASLATKDTQSCGVVPAKAKTYLGCRQVLMQGE